MDPLAVSFSIVNIKVRKLEVNGSLMHKFLHCQLYLAWQPGTVHSLVAGSKIGAVEKTIRSKSQAFCTTVRMACLPLSFLWVCSGYTCSWGRPTNEFAGLCNECCRLKCQYWIWSNQCSFHNHQVNIRWPMGLEKTSVYEMNWDDSIVQTNAKHTPTHFKTIP